MRFRPLSEAVLDRRFLFWFLLSDGFTGQAWNASTGSAQSNVGPSHVKKFTIPVPPLPEQRRIVAKLDRLRARSARARDELDRIPKLIERYKQAILAKAFSGELTAEWRADARIVGNWGTRRIGELVERITAGKNLRCEERPPTDGERGVVKVSAVTWGTFDGSQAKTLPYDFDPPTRTRISKGDFLISRANTLELVGAAVIADSDPGNLYLSDKILRLEMPDQFKSWLLWFLRSPHGRSEIESRATGNQLSMRNLSQEELRAIPVPWPTDLEREEIVRRIASALQWVERIAHEQHSASSLLPRLDQSILAKAFRGELVPQDPNDEPASVMLDRLRAEREAGPSAARRGRRSA